MKKYNKIRVKSSKNSQELRSILEKICNLEESERLKNELITVNPLKDSKDLEIKIFWDYYRKYLGEIHSALTRNGYFIQQNVNQ